jgi:hypothetical protein
MYDGGPLAPAPQRSLNATLADALAEGGTVNIHYCSPTPNATTTNTAAYGDAASSPCLRAFLPA